MSDALIAALSAVAVAIVGTVVHFLTLWRERKKIAPEAALLNAQAEKAKIEVKVDREVAEERIREMMRASVAQLNADFLEKTDELRKARVELARSREENEATKAELRKVNARVDQLVERLAGFERLQEEVSSLRRDLEEALDLKNEAERERDAAIASRDAMAEELGKAVARLECRLEKVEQEKAQLEDEVDHLTEKNRELAGRCADLLSRLKKQEERSGEIDRPAGARTRKSDP